jgi:hypothetical protein
LKQHFTLRMQPMTLAPPNAPGRVLGKPKDGQTLIPETGQPAIFKFRSHFAALRA